MTADLVLGMLLAGAALASQSPDKQLQSKDPLVRIRAIETLRSAATEADVKRLTQALRDRDWEVREKAAEILGTTGSKQALEPLVKLCLKGEVARMRYAAALALAEIDAAAAAKLLSKKLSAKKTARNACEALMVLYARGGSGNPSKRIRRLLSSDDTREAACLAQFAAQTKRGDPLRKILASDLAVGAAALDMMRRMPRAGDLAALAPLMNGKRLHEVLERRLRHALRAALSAEPEPGKAAARLLDSLEENAVTRTRQARLLPLLVRARILGKAAASGRLAPCLESRDAGARAAAAKGLREVGGEAAWKLALARFDQEDSARVRFQLMETIVRLRGLSQPPWVSWLAERLGDEDPKVRERAAVLLGRRGLDGAHPALVAALRDPDWTVAVCAAVSLGKSFEDEAVAPLVDLARHADWKLRGAAIVGLMHLNREAVVETLIGAVADPVPMVARAAHEGLRRISSRNDIQRKRSAWRAWWKAERKRHVFEDWQEIEENRKKYGYAVPDRDIYAGLDIVVLLSRGDHIEKLLDRLEIGYRETQASKVLEAGLHPEAICVINCTGEIVSDDVEPLSWFVRTGGALFGSCWALSKSIELVYPGVLRKFETPRGQVLDNVRAYPCSDDSPFLTGVFPDFVTPIYRLEGAHLIEVLDPERAEVLIDSPDAAQRHGSGDLAAWFRAGHGVILDSVNHFDLQGLELAPGLKTPADRQVYAIDHMGMSYARWRELRKKKFWSSSPKAAKQVPDLSAFRFITNFVRAKRIGADGK